MYDYSKEELVKVFKKIGLKRNDVVLCHSNVIELGFPKGKISKKNIFQTIFNAFFDVIKNTGTLIVPSYTYSFTKKEIFDPEKSKNICGLFSEELQKKKNVSRYLDPNQSFLVYGKNKNFFCKNPSNNSYDENSMWARLIKKNAKICNLNLNAGSTFIHYVERKIGVNYRFDKTFKGKIKYGKSQKNLKSTLFVRKMNKKSLAQFEVFTQLALINNYYKKTNLGKGFIGQISCKNVFKLIKSEIKKSKYFLTIKDARYERLKKIKN
jgi:aminoglycoside 3-N-acetyltransferase